MYSLRLATIDDLDLVSEIEAEAFPPAERASRERLAGRMAVFADDFLILFEDGRPVGYVAGMATNRTTIVDEMFANPSMHEPQGKYQSVFSLAVQEADRRKGCGATLMRAFIEKARQEGREGVILTCKEKLIHYYAKFGFVNEGVSESKHGGAEWYDMIIRFDRKKASD